MEKDEILVENWDIPGSVPRFGKISPLWRHFKSFGIFAGLISIWQHSEPTLANVIALLHIVNIFYCLGESKPVKL